MDFSDNGARYDVRVKRHHSREHGIPGIALSSLLASAEADCTKILSEFGFNSISQRLGRIGRRPLLLVRENNAIHVASLDANNGSSARLALQGNKTESLLHARVNEEIGRAVEGRQFMGIRAIRHPVNTIRLPLEIGYGRSLSAISDTQ